MKRRTLDKAFTLDSLLGLMTSSDSRLNMNAIASRLHKSRKVSIHFDSDQPVIISRSLACDSEDSPVSGGTV